MDIDEKPLETDKVPGRGNDVWVKHINQHGCSAANAIIQELQNALGNDIILAGGFGEFIDRLCGFVRGQIVGVDTLGRNK